MAEKRPSGFRFRLPWLLQPALTSRPAIAPEPPRTTTKTSAASAPAQRPPFRPPGTAPAPVASPPALTTPPPPPASPTRAQPRSASLQASVASSPPRVPAKSSAPRPAIAKTLDPVANQPTKETQTTSQIAGEVPPAAATTANDDETQAATEMASPATPPAVDKVAATIETQTTRATPPPAVPLVAAGTAEDDETQAATVMASPANPPPAVPLVAAGTAEYDETQAATVMASPATPPAVDKAGNAIETQPTKEPLTTTGPKPATETPAPATSPQRPTLRPPSPVNIQPLQRDTTPRSSSRFTSQPTNKPSSVPRNTPEIKRSSTDLDHVPQGADLVLDAKPKETAKDQGTQHKSLNPHSMDKITETKSQKPSPITSTPLSLHSEIKDDIFRFIRKMATNPSKRYTDEKPASIVTVAGDNTGASMHLGSGYKVNSDKNGRDAAINGEGSSNGKKWRKVSKSSETKAIVNSNIQGINNSMMFNCSVTERNPGVHVGFSVNKKDSKMKNRESIETHRAEANITPQQTLVYDPTISRCIEGVSMEEAAKDNEIEIV